MARATVENPDPDTLYLTAKSFDRFTRTIGSLPATERDLIFSSLRFQEIYLPAGNIPEVAAHLRINAHEYAQALAQNDQENMILYINTDADKFVANAARVLTSGFILLSDYGHSTHMLFDRIRNGEPQLHMYGPDPTLQGTAPVNPYSLIAMHSFLTTNQNFTGIANRGSRKGLRVTWYGHVRDLMQQTSVSEEILRGNEARRRTQSLREFFDDRQDTGIFKILLLEKEAGYHPYIYSEGTSWPPLYADSHSLSPEQHRQVEHIQQTLLAQAGAASQEGYLTVLSFFAGVLALGSMHAFSPASVLLAFALTGFFYQIHTFLHVALEGTLLPLEGDTFKEKLLHWLQQGLQEQAPEGITPGRKALFYFLPGLTQLISAILFISLGASIPYIAAAAAINFVQSLTLFFGADRQGWRHLRVGPLLRSA